MITRAELNRRARRLGVQVAHIENDYVLCHLLASIAGELPELIFRGGTALARAYWPDYRLSEDLDFVGTQRIDAFARRLETAVSMAGETTGLSLRLRSEPPRRGRYRTFVEWDSHALLVDVVMDDEVVIEPDLLSLDLPYSDLRATRVETRVLVLAEILGSKWFMLDDRIEPRDLFDLWTALTKFDVSFADISKGHKARYGYNPSSGALQGAKRLRDLWEVRLEHQLSELPTFDEAYAAVVGTFEVWKSALDDA